MTRTVLVVLLAMSCLAIRAPLPAQEVRTTPVELRLRPVDSGGVDAEIPWQRGRLVEWSADSVRVGVDGGRRVSVSLRDFDIQMRQGDRGRPAAVIGLLLGAGAGALISHATFRPEYGRPLGQSIGALLFCPFTGCDLPEPVQINRRSTEIRRGALLGAAAGALVGRLIGRSMAHWVTVEPRLDGVGFTVRH